MSDPLTFVEGLLARLNGPMSFRFALQPIMAMFFAFRDGRKDAQEGHPPYFWALFTDPGHRKELLRSGWKGFGRVFILAIVLDGVFQAIVFRRFLLSGALYAGVLLAIIPYLLMRGPLNRYLTWRAK